MRNKALEIFFVMLKCPFRSERERFSTCLSSKRFTCGCKKGERGHRDMLIINGLAIICSLGCV